MPIISQFYGILIYMYWDDHNPPHFHLKYNEYEAEITINPISVKYGSVPKRVRSLVFEWAAEHQDELLVNWNLSKENKPLNKIAPLE